MTIRNLVIEGDEWLEGTLPGLGGRMLLSNLSPGARAVCSAILNQNMGALREQVENNQLHINTSLQVSAVGTDKMAHLWRTPLELAIECDAVDEPQMVGYLIEKGAYISTTALHIALMVAHRNISGLSQGHTRARDPGDLISVLTHAGAQWDQAVEGHPKRAREWKQIQAHYKTQERTVDQRLEALRRAAEAHEAPRPKKTRRPPLR